MFRRMRQTQNQSESQSSYPQPKPANNVRISGIAGFIAALFFIGGKLDKKKIESAIHRHRAHG